MVKIVEIMGPAATAYDKTMPQVGDIVQYTDYDGPDLVGSERPTQLNKKQGQVLNTPLYLKQVNVVRVIFHGREHALKINTDRLTILNKHKRL